MAGANRDPRSRTDLLWVLPLIGVLLLSPLVLAVFDRPATILGMPLLYVYIFFVWSCGIVLTRYAARRAPDDWRAGGRPAELAPGESQRIVVGDAPSATRDAWR